MIDVAKKNTKNNTRNKTPISILLMKTLYLSLFLSLVSIVLILIFFKKLPPEIPLLYGLPYGEQQLTDKVYFVTPSLLSITIVSINFFIAKALEDKLLRGILIVGGFIVCLLSFIATLKIFFLVGSF